MLAAVCARCARACSTSSEETRPGLNSPAGDLEVVVLSAERAARDGEPRLRETRVDVVCGDLASDRGADTLEIEQRRELFSPRCLNAAPQSAK